MNTAENQISAKKPLPLPVGNSDWQHIAAYNWCADKTQILWSLLVHTGYLKVLSGPNSLKMAMLAIPNREVREVFQDDILIPIQSAPTGGRDLQGILAALTTRDQIDERRYAAEMETTGIPVLKYGVGFSGKRVALAK